jgi:iron only hydrogenase large subunit-like protein
VPKFGKVNVAVASGWIMPPSSVKSQGRKVKHHFIEIMTCPGGA